MDWFKNLKIRTKILGIVLILVAVLTYLVYDGISDLGEANADLDSVYQDRVVPLAQLKDVSDNYGINIVDATVGRYIGIMSWGDSRRNIRDARVIIDRRWNEYMATQLTTEEARLAERVESLEHIADEAIDELEVIMANEDDEALALFLQTELFQNIDPVVEAINDLIDLQLRVAEEIYVEAEQRYAAAVRENTIIAVISVIVAIGIALFIANLISRSLREVIDKMDNADLNTLFEADNKDEIGELTRSFDKFVIMIREALLNVQESSSSVASASAEISSSTEQMAAGAQEQTSQAGEVSSAVEEMTKTIIENSKNASDTATTAKETKQTAEGGYKVVQETIEGMRRIAEVVKHSAETVGELGKSSDQIGEIISVIDDIADQTNLLALNAAIEAARAGEQGRGFAVVADEVRKLAERTTKATKEIAGMIKKIQSDTGGAVGSMEEGTKKVDEGIDLANKAGQSLQNIVNVVQKVTDMIAQIATASEQQSSASEQISKNVEAISSVTQQNASGTEQVARAVDDLSRLTQGLQEMVGQFKLDSNGSHREQQKPKSTKRQPGKRAEEKSSSAVRENGYLVESE